MRKFIMSFYFLLSLLVFKNAISQSFELTTKQQDFEPIERFFAIADSLKDNQTISNHQLTSYFQIPVIALYAHNPDLDSAKYVNDMKLIYKNIKKYISDTSGLSDNQKLLAEYMKHEGLIKAVVLQMQKQNINDSIKKLLFPFLPESLRQDSLLPKQIYMYLEEGNGGLPGYVFNSMLQTAMVNNYKCGIISAHESYHAIVGKIFSSLFNENFNQQSPEASLIFLLDQFAEEGIADLIDKPMLNKAGSPLYKEVQELIKDDSILSPIYIQRLDSLFKNAYQTKKSEMINWRDYSKNTGHIPGRFMGLAIQKAGLLEQCQEHIGDPISFFEYYNKATEKDKSLPRFSKGSMLYLQQLRKTAFDK